MAERYQDDTITQAELDSAKKRLTDFQASCTGKHRMARLRHANSSHPVLWGLTFTMVSGLVMVLMAVALAVAPLASDEIARTFATLPGIKFLPVALVLLAFISGVLWVALFGIANRFGGQAPFLPADVKKQSQLRSDVHRLTVAKDVQKRLTNTPAPARTRRY